MAPNQTLEAQMVQIKAKWVQIQRWRPKGVQIKLWDPHFCLLAHPSERSGVHSAFKQPLRGPKINRKNDAQGRTQYHTGGS